MKKLILITTFLMSSMTVNPTISQSIDEIVENLSHLDPHCVKPVIIQMFETIKLLPPNMQDALGKEFRGSLYAANNNVDFMRRAWIIHQIIYNNL